MHNATGTGNICTSLLFLMFITLLLYLQQTLLWLWLYYLKTNNITCRAMRCAFISNCRPLQLLGSLASVSSVDSDGWFLLPPGVSELTISIIWPLQEPDCVCSQYWEPTLMLADKVWLTVRAPVHLKGIRWGWGQDSLQASEVLLYQTWKTMSLKRWLCAHVETGKGQTLTVEENIYYGLKYHHILWH